MPTLKVVTGDDPSTNKSSGDVMVPEAVTSASDIRPLPAEYSLKTQPQYSSSAATTQNKDQNNENRSGQTWEKISIQCRDESEVESDDSRSNIDDIPLASLKAIVKSKSREGHDVNYQDESDVESDYSRSDIDGTPLASLKAIGKRKSREGHDVNYQDASDVESDVESDDSRSDIDDIPLASLKKSREGNGNSSIIDQYPMKGIKDPGPNDILFRGIDTTKITGNIRFQQTIKGKRASYNDLSRMDKARLLKRLVGKWRAQDPPGRFLKLDTATQIWNDVGDNNARRRIAMSLRGTTDSIGKHIYTEESKRREKERYLIIRERRNARRRENYELNKEEERLKKKVRYEANKEKEQLKRKIRYESNREKEILKSKMRYESNREKELLNAKMRYERQIEQNRERQNAYNHAKRADQRKDGEDEQQYDDTVENEVYMEAILLFWMDTWKESREELNQLIQDLKVETNPEEQTDLRADIEILSKKKKEAMERGQCLLKEPLVPGEQWMQVRENAVEELEQLRHELKEESDKDVREGLFADIEYMKKMIKVAREKFSRHVKPTAKEVSTKKRRRIEGESEIPSIEQLMVQEKQCMETWTDAMNELRQLRLYSKDETDEEARAELLEDMEVIKQRKEEAKEWCMKRKKGKADETQSPVEVGQQQEKHWTEMGKVADKELKQLRKDLMGETDEDVRSELHSDIEGLHIRKEYWAKRLRLKK